MSFYSTLIISTGGQHTLNATVAWDLYVTSSFPSVKNEEGYYSPMLDVKFASLKLQFFEVQSCSLIECDLEPNQEDLANAISNSTLVAQYLPYYSKPYFLTGIPEIWGTEELNWKIDWGAIQGSGF